MADAERYAIVRAGKVENVTLWDGATTWAPPEDTTAVKDTQGKAQIGGTYSGGVFTAPPVVAPTPPSADDVLLEAAKVDNTVAPVVKAIIRKVKPDAPAPLLAPRRRSSSKAKPKPRQKTKRKAQ